MDDVWGMEMFQGGVHQVMGVVDQGMGQGVFQVVVDNGVGVVQGVTGVGQL